jgi:hypothetical protein
VSWLFNDRQFLCRAVAVHFPDGTRALAVYSPPDFTHPLDPGVTRPRTVRAHMGVSGYVVSPYGGEERSWLGPGRCQFTMVLQVDPKVRRGGCAARAPAAAARVRGRWPCGRQQHEECTDSGSLPGTCATPLPHGTPPSSLLLGCPVRSPHVRCAARRRVPVRHPQGGVPLPVYNTVHMMMPTYLQRIKMAAARLKPCEIEAINERQAGLLAASQAELDKARGKTGGAKGPAAAAARDGMGAQ